jgi:small subunit ribosomal protein S17
MKILEGKVTGLKMNKTATVLVESIKIHPIYKKRIKRNKKYHVHLSKEVKVGERVKIIQSRPISKTKKWQIIEEGKK